MDAFLKRLPINVPGKYYITRDCLDCAVCRAIAPQNILRDLSGYSYIAFQARNNEERDLLSKAKDGCPTNSIGDDGDKYDWANSKILPWIPT